ncbi:hypothetical protein BsWGS_07935 [Bradybaena similaris]
MAAVRKLGCMLTYLPLLAVFLGMFASITVAQDFQDADHSLTLTGPDEEDMMMCALPMQFALDATIEWYVNGRILKTELLARDNLHLYESLQDLEDLLGDYPRTIQCVINQGTINWVPVVSNVVNLNPQ